MHLLCLKYCKKLPLEAYVGFGLSLLILFYAFSPIRLGADFTFQNQTELIVVITALSWIGCAGILIKQACTSNFLKTITQLDLLLFAYLAYLLWQLLFYPLDKEYAFRILCLTAVYFLFRHIPARWINPLFYLLPVLAMVQIIYGYNRLTDPWQGLSDITGAFGNTGIFGGFIAIGLVTALGLMFFGKRHQYPIAQIILGILLIPLVIQLICSQSRAAWVAAAAGTMMLLFPVFRKLTKRNAALLISFLLIAGALFATKSYHFKKDSADGRLLIWTVSWNMFQEKPLTGFGPDGFQKNYLLRQGEYLKNHPDSPWADLADDSTSPFNEFLKTGVEQGVIGLLVIFGIIFITFKSMAKVPIPQAILAAIIGFACFSYPFEFIAFQVLGVFCLASTASTQKSMTIAGITGKSRFNLPKHWVMISKFISICLIVAISSFIVFSSCKYYADIKKWNHIIYSFSPKDNQKIAELQALYPALKRNAWFVFVYGTSVYQAEHYPEAVPLLEEALELFPNTQTLLPLGEAYEKTGAYSKALEAWETASNIKPVLFTPHYNRAKLYFKLQDYEQAKQEASKVINKKIKIDSPKINRMKQEMKVLYERDN